MNEGELKAKELHKNIVAIVLPAYKVLIDGVKDQGVFRKNYTNLEDNNVTARHCAVYLGLGESLTDFCSTTSGCIEIETVILNSGTCIKDLSVSYKGVQYNIDENWPWGQYTVVYKIPYDTDTINDGGKN